VGRCDIGAIEFEGALPNVNDLVTFTPLPSSFTTTADPAGCPAGFAGTFRFAARLMAKASSRSYRREHAILPHFLYLTVLQIVTVSIGSRGDFRCR
jgi:hypothetical protein